jgi:phage shock protein C
VVRERLYRSRDDRVLFGVAGGMAEWLDIDPAVVRLVWALLVVFGGAGLILYIIAAIVIPEEPYEVAGMPGVAPAGTVPPAAGTSPDATGGPGAPAQPTYWTNPADARAARRAARAARRAERSNTGGIVFGVILVLVGLWFLARDLFPTLDDRYVGPGILILIGAVLVVAALRRPNQPPSA